MADKSKEPEPLGNAFQKVHWELGPNFGRVHIPRNNIHIVENVVAKVEHARNGICFASEWLGFFLQNHLNPLYFMQRFEQTEDLARLLQFN